MMLPPDHPVFTRIMLRKDLIAAGHSNSAISRMLDSGELARARYGAYVAGETWRDLDEAQRYGVRCRAVQLRARSELVLSHVSALPLYGVPLWGLDLSVAHGTRRDGRAGRKEAGVRQHAGLLLDEDVVRTGDGALVTSPARTCLDVSMVAPLEAAWCVVNHMLHVGLVDIADLRRRYESSEVAQVRSGRDSSGLRRASMEHWPGSLRTGLLLRLADGRCESVGETRTLHLCWAAGLAMPEVQHEVRDETGRVVARLDFAWPELGVYLEFDGRVKYTDHVPDGQSVVDVVLREKRREERVSELTGWRCIRITWADLEHPERTIDRIRAALRAGRLVG